MEYDYYGFPEHTYHIRYPAPGAPWLAWRVKELLGSAGVHAAEDPKRGFDHGVFVPLSLMYPNADVPVVMMSMKSDYDPVEHIRIGAVLAPLRDEGVLIVGSGLTYHNMRDFGSAESLAVSTTFEKFLGTAVVQEDPSVRNGMLSDWERAPMARSAHPQEDRYH